MGRNSKILAAAFLSLVVASCASSGEQQSQTPNPVLANNTPVPTKQTNQQRFNHPIVPAKETPQGTQAVPNLIQPTNATERIHFISKGRSDPFGELVKVYPQAEQVPNPTIKTRAIPAVPSLPAIVKVAKVTAKQSAVIAAKLTPPKNTLPKKQVNPSLSTSRSVTSVLPRVLPQVIPNPKLTPVLPPPPQPELAKAVFVSGVVLLGKQPLAIIKVPNEPTSRYVQVGQRLANGVLIKRIEMNEGSEPIVILEQYGIEVARMVGEAPANTAAATKTAAVENSVLETSPAQKSVSIGSS